MKRGLWLLLVCSAAWAGDYNRDDWAHWLDYDGDCRNTRHEVLEETSLLPVIWDGCYVESGVWLDPYTGRHFSLASDLDLDHVVPLKWAHDHGGADWPPMVKALFANDRENLLPVALGENRKKGADGPDAYLPPAGRCPYLNRWRTVVNRYGLTPEPEVRALLDTPCIP